MTHRINSLTETGMSLSDQRTNKDYKYTKVSEAEMPPMVFAPKEGDAPDAGAQSASPTVQPTVAPTATPTVASTAKPAATTTAAPTSAPTVNPTVSPTAKPGDASADDFQVTEE